MSANIEYLIEGGQYRFVYRLKILSYPGFEREIYSLIVPRAIPLHLDNVFL